MNIELVNYIKAAKEHGLKDSEVKQNLLNAGWEAPDVEDAFTHYIAALHPSAGQEAQESLLSKAMMPQQDQKAHQAAQTVLPASSKTLPTVAAISSQMPQASLTQKTGKSHLGLWLGLTFLILLLAGGAYAAYAFGPGIIWNKFAAKEQAKIFQNKFTIFYNDDRQQAEPDSPSAQFGLKNLKLQFDGDYYVNAANAANPESSAEVKYTFGSSGTDFSTSLKYRQKGQVMYLNIGSNPFLDMISQSLMAQSGSSKKLEWMKLDLEAIKKASSDGQVSGSQDYSDFYQVFNDRFVADLQKTWKETKLIKVKKTLGAEKVNGKMTLHYQNELDKQALINVINTIVDKVNSQIAQQKPGQEAKPAELEMSKKIVSGIVNKISITNFETWVGLTDFQLYKVRFESNAVSLLSLFDLGTQSLHVARSSSRDAKRLADVRQVASALELYYNDFNGYPESVNGAPEDLSPTYIAQFPNSPAPADGVCSDYYNTYWYSAKGTKKIVKGKNYYSDYQLEFCLGKSTGGYQAGLAKLTPSGITAGLPCNDTPDHCKASEAVSAEDGSDDQKAIDDFINKLQFSAQLKLTSEYNDIAVIKSVDEPKEFYDLTQMLLSAQSKSRDAKRLSDIRQLASGLELYYNDKNAYPKELKDLTPGYIGAIPQAAVPADGSCTQDQNAYAYKNIKNNSYELTFCLGANAAGYDSGVHILTPAGIK